MFGYRALDDFPGGAMMPFPPSEFSSKHPDRTNRVNIVHKFDISQGNESGPFALLWWNSVGNAAVAFGSELVTDFIYDNTYTYYIDNQIYAASTVYAPSTDVIAVSLNGKWGVVDRNGNTVVPHEFEHIMPIDNNSAFAKINGRYGILQIPG
jgi:hypothetical protein